MTISQRSREIAQIIYQSDSELIDNDAKFGSDWDKRVAKTIQHLAGVSC
ncbi:hypothetical protein [uncultured Methanolobus sp.]|nr:hypothetical protein [uncultured Methanolobus sp.]